MFKSRSLLPGLVLLLALAAVACSPQAEVISEDEATSEEMMEEESMNDEMSEDDMMDDQMAEDEMTDDEMAEDDMAEDDMTTADDDMADNEMMDAVTTFVVRIENTADEDGLTILAPGAYELNDHPVSFFDPGEADRGQGLEALAEDGDPSILVGTIGEMMEGDMMGFAVDLFNTPAGADAPGPAGPSAAYEFTVEAYPGQFLTFATMFVHSNDWFFAPGAEGIELFLADGEPLSGDITNQILLWNAGTEVDQTPGEGADQAPRQSGPNTGESEGGVVSLVDEFSDYQILVTITPQS